MQLVATNVLIQSSDLEKRTVMATTVSTSSDHGKRIKLKRVVQSISDKLEILKMLDKSVSVNSVSHSIILESVEVKLAI